MWRSNKKRDKYTSDMWQKDLEDGSEVSILDINIVFVVVVLKKTEDVNIFIGSDRVRQHWAR